MLLKAAEIISPQIPDMPWEDTSEWLQTAHFAPQCEGDSAGAAAPQQPCLSYQAFTPSVKHEDNQNQSTTLLQLQHFLVEGYQILVFISQAHRK